jgi:type VI protein secretion system component VasF
MTELDELLSRLRRLEPIAPDPALSASLRERGHRRLRRPLRPAPLASLAVFSTVIVYLGWALHFASALYP